MLLLLLLLMYQDDNYTVEVISLAILLCFDS